MMVWGEHRWYEMYCTHIWYLNTRLKPMDYYPSDDGIGCTVHTYDTWTQDSNSEIITPQMMVCTVHTYDAWTLSTRLTDREYLRQELLWTGVVLCTEYFVAGASAIPDGPGCPGNCFSKGNLFYCCGFSAKWLREKILDQLELFDSV